MRLTAEGCKARREKLISAVEADLLIITDPRHIHYLAGLFTTPLLLSGLGTNFLLIDTASGHSKLIIHNFLEDPNTEIAFVDEIEVWTWYDAAHNPGIPIFRQGLHELNKHLRPLSPRRVGIEQGTLSYGAEIANPVDLTDILIHMRRVKYPDELVLIREAIRAIEAGHHATRSVIQPGVTELDVYNAVNTAIVNEIGHPVLPLGDFASGERSWRGGGPPTQRVLQAGDLMIVDLFPVINGYKGDYTGTISVNGELTDLQTRLEAALHAALSAGESMLKPGSRGKEVYQALRSGLAEYGFGDHIPHHAGHGIGLGHPEAIFFVRDSEEVLRAGEVVTLEPGAYGEGFGARIEHNYLITETGFERLTHHATAFVTPR